jgi:hypothetical protein
VSGRYVTGEKINISSLRHDIAALVMPFEMAIELSGSEIDPKVSLLQNEILKNLNTIVQELKLLPEMAALK